MWNTKKEENEVQTDVNEIIGDLRTRAFTQNCTILHSKTETPN